MRVFILVLITGIFLIFSSAWAKGMKVSNEMIYQKLLEIEKRQIVLETQFKEFKEATNKRFEDMNKRFEDMNKRFEDMNKRFEELRVDMNKRFEEQMKFLQILAGVFTTLVLGVIGFAIWDRRTIIRRAKEEAIIEIEKEGRLRDLIRALRELAKKNTELAEVLKKFNLL